MLWRPTYETRIRRGFALPRLEGLTLDGGEAATPTTGALLGAFDPRAGAELGVWRRLLDEAGLSAFTVFVRPAWTPRERRALALATAPAQHPWTLLVEDPGESWASVIETDRPERAFAAVLHEEVTEPLMVGLPTEEAWDEFKEAIRAIGPEARPTAPG